MGIPPEVLVLPFGMKDNFWEMGETGLCGHIALRSTLTGLRDASSQVDDPDVLEIWNIAFTAYIKA